MMGDGSMYAVVRTRFGGVHHWPSATGKHAYLRHPHRHLFHVTLWVRQPLGGDRATEYLAALDGLKLACERLPAAIGDESTDSCETMAQHVTRMLREQGHDVAACEVRGLFGRSTTLPR